MNNAVTPSSVQSDLETAAAPFLALGILYALAGLLPLGAGMFLRPFNAPFFLLGVWTFCSGLGLAVVGFGIRRRWRYLLPVAALLSIPGLLQVPIGTLLFGWVLYSLWKCRECFYPFDRTITPKS